MELEYYWIYKKVEVSNFKGSPPDHYFLSCEKCCKKYKYDINLEKIFKKPKVKKVIDTKGWIEGEPTKKGNKRYIFIKKDGTEVTLLAESGIKKGLNPKKTT
jgi:hypothetical protein